MKVNIKKLKDLERKIIVSVPTEEYESKFNTKITNIKTKKLEINPIKKSISVLMIIFNIWKFYILFLSFQLKYSITALTILSDSFFW